LVNTCTVVGDARQVRLSIERNGLIARVIARHEALTAVYAHILHAIIIIVIIISIIIIIMFA